MPYIAPRPTACLVGPRSELRGACYDLKMNEKPEKPFNISRRGFLAGAAAALVATRKSEANAQSFPHVEQLTSRDFRFQVARERVQFPAADLLQ